MPTAFDVVWCKFPYRQHGTGPGPVARPCLVRQSFISDVQINGKQYPVGWIEVVYGTKQIDKFAAPRGLHVDSEDEKKACGLTEDTVFDLQESLKLPWSPVYFSSDGGKPTVSGRFTDAMIRRVREQYEAQKAEPGE